MSRRNKELPLLHEVRIEDAGAEGMAVARVDGLVVFVPFVVPGDVVDVQLYKKKKNYAEGRAVYFHSKSPLRVDPMCSHFGVCGGCKWQTMRYESQLDAKQRLVKDCLVRIGTVDCSQMLPIKGASHIDHYRNKLEFTFSSKPWRTPEEMMQLDSFSSVGALGFHIPQLFDKVLDIKECALQREPSNAIRIKVKQLAIELGLSFYDARTHEGQLRNLVIRCSSVDEWMVIVVVSELSDKVLDLLDALYQAFPQITSLHYVVNTKWNDSFADLEVCTYKGKGNIEEEMLGYQGGKNLRFVINPKSFYQTNSEQAQVLYSAVADMADLQSDEVLYDLYTGTGTIALFLAAMCKKVVGIEYVEDAVADARVNALRNGFDNTEFYAGDMAKVLTDEFVSQHGKPDVVVTDPPRAGMHERVVTQLMTMAPRKIVYVSCNPATQARDLKLLLEGYQVGRIQPVDMFPHTQHVENVVELIRK